MRQIAPLDPAIHHEGRITIQGGHPLWVFPHLLVNPMGWNTSSTKLSIHPLENPQSQASWQIRNRYCTSVQRMPSVVTQTIVRQKSRGPTALVLTLHQ